jgi:hypothetical protein
MIDCLKWLNYDSRHQSRANSVHGIKHSHNIVMFVTGGFEVDEMSNDFCWSHLFVVQQRWQRLLLLTKPSYCRQSLTSNFTIEFLDGASENSATETPNTHTSQEEEALSRIGNKTSRIGKRKAPARLRNSATSKSTPQYYAYPTTLLTRTSCK